MAISPVALKGLIGVGAVSTVALGGTYIYKKVLPSTSRTINRGFDNFALNSQHGDWTWTPIDNNPTTKANQDTIVEITGTLNGKGNDEGKTWTCKIKGIIPSTVTNPPLGVKEQVDELKTQISDQNKFKNFLNNCIRHRENALADDATNSEITIDLGNLEVINSVYKFKVEDFKKLYEGEYWNQAVKEKTVNIRCTENTCQKIGNDTPKGLNSTSESLTIAKDTMEDPARFNRGIKYKVSGTADQNGDYQIVKSDSGDFVLKKVNELTLEEIGTKLKLTCKSGNNPTCTVPSNWEAGFYKDEKNYAKVSGVTPVNVSTNTTANTGYYGGHKFTFEGSTTTSNPTDGEITITTNKGHSIKYTKVLGYTFFQVET